MALRLRQSFLPIFFVVSSCCSFCNRILINDRCKCHHINAYVILNILDVFIYHLIVFLTLK